MSCSMALLPLLDDPSSHPEPSPQREAIVAALNGVLGDRLQAISNPLAQSMELRQPGAFQSGSHLLLLVHGLCMNDTQWRRDGHDHGVFLAQALGATPVYLRYNSGLHTSVNGRELDQKLDSWWRPGRCRCSASAWSATAWAGWWRVLPCTGPGRGQRWPALVRELVFLGTPHHGAPLEQAGHGADWLLASNPFTAPFARLGKIRSAGITDLRHGHVQDADWQGRDRFASGQDHRVPLPLPEGVACFAVAATLAGQRSLLADRLVGDGLVPLRSALGQHDGLSTSWPLPRDSQRIVYRTGHLDLLSSPKWRAATAGDWLSRPCARSRS
jgi:hypothetical protein